ncbi:MAG TPA: hypothetical protein VLC93_02210, partial [Myxococcota bacterium]|nr:hypothetical protein [Myxococcota bacterium]
DVDFQSTAMSFHDVDGFAHIFANATPGILTFNSNGTASGALVVSSSQLGPPDEEVQHCVLVPSGDGIEWELFLD